MWNIQKRKYREERYIVVKERKHPSNSIYRICAEFQICQCF